MCGSVQLHTWSYENIITYFYRVTGNEYAAIVDTNIIANMDIFSERNDNIFSH